MELGGRLQLDGGDEDRSGCQKPSQLRNKKQQDTKRHTRIQRDKCDYVTKQHEDCIGWLVV